LLADLRRRSRPVEAVSVKADIDGTLVGLWSPGFHAFSVCVYHFHFLSRDRRHGGYRLDLEPLRLKIEALTDFHLPEQEFG
jgi:acetolactate decarboxylase